MIDVTIGIVSLNGRSFLEQCLQSIYRANCSYSIEIVLVDNASTDGTAAWVQAEYPDVCLLRNAENVGIAKGNNQCIDAASGRYVLLLNSDTIMLPGMLDRLIRFADQHPEAGAVGGKLLNADGSFQSSYSDFPTLWSEFLHVTRLWVVSNPYYPSQPDCSDIRAVDWICSACLLVRKEAVDRVGRVDERYFIYSDETDLQYKLRQAGWRVYYLPDVTTIHFGGRSTSAWRRRKLIYRGKLLFFQNHYGVIRALLLRSVFATVSLLKMLVWTVMWLVPNRQERARNEIESNLAVVRLSLSHVL